MVCFYIPIYISFPRKCMKPAVSLWRIGRNFYVCVAGAIALQLQGILISVRLAKTTVMTTRMIDATNATSYLVQGFHIFVNIVNLTLKMTCVITVTTSLEQNTPIYAVNVNIPYENYTENNDKPSFFLALYIISFWPIYMKNTKYRINKSTLLHRNPPLYYFMRTTEGCSF